MPYSARGYAEGLNEVRRDLRAMSRESGREFDKRAKQIAVKVRDDARAHTPKRTGRTARSITVSSTYKGIAVRSGKPWFGQIEYGRQIWLNRGLPYAKPKGAGPSVARGGVTSTGRQRGSIELRQRPATPGKNGQPRVINQGRYLIERRKPINNAANRFAPVLEREAEQMIEDLKRKHHLS